MRPRDDSIRIMSASAGISMEKTRTGACAIEHKRVLRQIHGKAGFPHGGTPGDDHQIRRLQTAGHAVQIREARGQTGNGAFRGDEAIDAVHRLLQQSPSILRPPGLGPPLGDLENFPLRLIEELRTLPPLGGEGGLRDAIGRRDQLAKGWLAPGRFPRRP